MSVELPLRIREHIDTFTGRTWLLLKLQTWLRERHEPVFLITGLPGTGKSMLAAWLAGFGPTPADPVAAAQLAQLRAMIRGAHFCIAGASVAPQDVIGGLACRLTEMLPGFDKALVASNGREVQITINQQAGSVSGSMTGFVVERLVLGDITPERALSLLLVDPLHRLYAARDDTQVQVVLLVDALDEAETFSVRPKVAQLLSGLHDSPHLPRQVRILATTRPDPRVLAYFKPIPHESNLDLIDGAPVEADDIAQYAQERLAGLDADRRMALTQKVAAAAKGIFLYAHLVLEDLCAHPPARVEVETLELPRDLSDLYLQFLLREIGAEERWYATYYPVLGLIAVAQGEGLSRTQIQGILGKPRPEVEPALRACAQYLAGSVPDGPFRPFHQSFAEFLLDDEYNTDRHIDAAEMHRLIADYYWNTYGTNWAGCDEYGLKHVPAHLKGVGQIDRLNELLVDFEWLYAKLRATEVHALRADYELTDDPEVKLVGEALRLSANALVQDKQQLTSQLVGRLLSYESRMPRIKGLLERIRAWKGAIWLRPVTSSLPQPRGVLVCTLAGHSSRVATVVVTSDELYAISASDDQTLKVWDLQQGQEVRTLRGHTAEINNVVLTHDEGYVVSASADHTLKVWDWQAGKLVHTLSGHSHIVRSVVLTPRGRFAISASYDNTLKVWDWQNGEELYRLEGHERQVTGVAVIHDGHNAISVGGDGTLRAWDLESGDEVGTIFAHSDPIVALALTHDERYAITVALGRTLKVWDLQSGKEIHTFRHWSAVRAVVVTPDGRFAISASNDQTLKVWDLQQGQEVRTLRGHTAEVNDVVLTHDARYALSASRDQTVKVWDWRAGKEVRTLSGHSAQVSTVVLTPKERYAISASGDNTLKVWDWQGAKEVRTSEGHDSAVMAMALTSDGRHVISASADNTLKVWDWQAGKLVRTLEGDIWQWQEGPGKWVQPLNGGHVGVVRAVVLTRDGRYAISASDDETLKVWDWHEGTVLQTLVGDSGVVIAVVLTLDGQYAISASGTLEVWDWQAGKLVCNLGGHSNMVAQVVLTLDGQCAISASADNTLKVWDWQAGKLVHTLTGHSDVVNAVALTPDGRYVISASGDYTLKVWDWQNGVLVTSFLGEGKMRRSLVAPNNTTIIAGDVTGQMYFLRLEGV